MVYFSILLTHKLWKEFHKINFLKWFSSTWKCIIILKLSYIQSYVTYYYFLDNNVSIIYNKKIYISILRDQYSNFTKYINNKMFIRFLYSPRILNGLIKMYIFWTFRYFELNFFLVNIFWSFEYLYFKYILIFDF